MHIATISSKNQITIPVRLLRKLDLKSGQKIILEEKENIIIATPIKGSIVDQVAGSLNKYISSDKLNKPGKEIEDEAYRLAAEEIAKEGL